MASIDPGYDLSTTTYSPDGRMLQIEYASKVVCKSPVIIGLVCKDGIVIVAEIKNENTNQIFDHLNRIFQLNKYTSIGTSGNLGDVHFVLERSRFDNRNYQKNFSDILTGKLIVYRICSFLHLYTLYWHIRPLACSLIIGTISTCSLELYLVLLTGFFTKCFGCAVGENSELIKTSLETLLIRSLSCRKNIESIIRILKNSKTNEKIRKLEIFWFTKENFFFDKSISCNLINESLRLGKVLE
nr:26S proteasome SU alpha7 [Cryptomonas sp.]